MIMRQLHSYFELIDLKRIKKIIIIYLFALPLFYLAYLVYTSYVLDIKPDALLETKPLLALGLILNLVMIFQGYSFYKLNKEETISKTTLFLISALIGIQQLFALNYAGVVLFALFLAKLGKPLKLARQDFEHISIVISFFALVLTLVVFFLRFNIK